ncbi:hypothetical protein [Sediminibacterium goheungense]|uniref:Uncharacterized protein n=1 Tax=Sediminibacterium goheungense TaxID=1086393 RepID=A0A4R6J0R3_9BACT|nr:hypothetical protein [Sediminibacterium goheungense]TDO28804.1 hypothetical protein BC659_0884 [Sediminibacterium goheungense]
MRFLKRIFGKLIPKENISFTDTESEHAVIIYFQYGIEGLESLYELEDKLEYIITQNKVGEYDGHEIATDLRDGFLYMYGPNAEQLFKTVEPTLMETNFLKGATITLRFGPSGVGAKEIEITL